MDSQREIVAQSLLIPNHGVYPIRPPKEEPQKLEIGEKEPVMQVPAVDCGEW